MQETSARAFHVLAGIFFLNSISWRAGKLLIALGALALGADAFTVGVLAAAYSFVPMLVSVHAGRISDRLGLRKPVVFGAACLVLAALVPLVELNLTTLLICPVLLGLGQLFLQVTVHNGVGSVSPPEQRSTNYARLQVGGSLAALCGPLLVGLAVDHLGLRAGFCVVLVSALAIIGATFALRRHLTSPPRLARTAKKERAADLLAHPGLRKTLFTSAVAICGLELFAFYIPIYGSALELSATVIGAVLAAQAAAAFVVRAILGPLVKRVSDMKLLTVALFVGAASFALIPLFGNAVVLFAAATLLGLSLGVATPLTQAMAYTHSPPGRTGEALGLRLFVNKAMQVAVPLAFGSLGTALGVTPVFWANAAILCIGGFVSSLSLRETR